MKVHKELMVAKVLLDNQDFQGSLVMMDLLYENEIVIVKYFSFFGRVQKGKRVKLDLLVQQVSQ